MKPHQLLVEQVASGYRTLQAVLASLKTDLAWTAVLMDVLQCSSSKAGLGTGKLCLQGPVPTACLLHWQDAAVLQSFLSQTAVCGHAPDTMSAASAVVRRPRHGAQRARQGRHCRLLQQIRGDVGAGPGAEGWQAAAGQGGSAASLQLLDHVICYPACMS